MKFLEDTNSILLDWFDKIEGHNSPDLSDLNYINFDLCQIIPNFLIQNVKLKLFLGKDGFYYILMKVYEPIGDYRSYWKEHFTKCWYKCKEQYISKIESILDMEG